MTQKKQENLVYLGIWIIIFLSPLTKLMSSDAATVGASKIWDYIFTTWFHILPFLALFLIHNFLVLPFLTVKGKRAVYGILTVCLLVLFGGHVWSTMPSLPKSGRNHHGPHAEMFEPGKGMGHQMEAPAEGNDGGMRPQDMPEHQEPPMHHGGPGHPGGPDNMAGPENMGGPDGPGEMRHPGGPDNMDRPDGPRPEGPQMKDGKPQLKEGEQQPFKDRIPDKGKYGRRPVRPLTPAFMMMLLAIFVLGINLAIELLFRSIQKDREMQELKEQNLNSQLQYLRHQISPHFFMNTLNNIHALVDIDPEQAKGSILQLSKLMRYMLYEGDKQTIPLEKEISFLEQYISLMKLRYNEKVHITFNAPEQIPAMEVPPLLFITFVENAFKHGVSYNEDSFIDISIDFKDEKVDFTCKNSMHEESGQKEESGIGLENTRRRLDLLYGSDYSLDIKDDGKEYAASVEIPSRPTIKTATT